jgi:hypothetical protein
VHELALEVGGRAEDAAVDEVRPLASFLTKSYNVLDKQSYLVPTLA